MRLFLIVLLAGALSAAAAFAVVYLATHGLPRFDDAASIGMGEVFGIIGTSMYAPVAMTVFGATLWRGGRERGIAIAALALLAPIALILLIGMAGGGRFSMRELQGMLQFVVPLALVVVLQWLVLRTYLRRQG
jgi:hypothetical protein